MIQVGSMVRLRPPFSLQFPDQYLVVKMEDDGSVAVGVPGYDHSDGVDGSGNPEGPGGCDFDPALLIEVG